MTTVFLDVWDGAAWQPVDIDAAGIADFVLKTSTESPHSLTFTAQQPQHIVSIGGVSDHKLIRLRADDYDGGGGLGVDPLFEGIVHPEPTSETIGVNFTALDPTAYTNHPLFSYGWKLDTGEVVPKTGGRPRVCWNCKQDTDDDYTWSRSYNSTMAEIIAEMFDDQQPALELEFSGPAGGGDAYNAADFSGMDLIPQDKLVFESEGLRSALSRTFQEHYPNARIVWEPGTRLWRITDLKTATEVTLTLNDPTATDVVLSCQLRRSLEDRYTAVEIYGPPAWTQWDEFHAHPTRWTTIDTTLNGPCNAGDTTIIVADGTVFGAVPGPQPVVTIIFANGDIVIVTGISGNTLTVAPLANDHDDNSRISKTAEQTLLSGGLTDLSGTDFPIDTWGAGLIVYAPYKFQITNPDERTILRHLKYDYTVPVPGARFGSPTSGYTIINTFYQAADCPVLGVRYLDNNMGDGKFQCLNGFFFDPRVGKIYFADGIALFRYNPEPPLRLGITGPKCEVPEDLQFVYCSPADPLKVRWPETGYAGTAYTVAGIEKTKRISDELLSLNAKEHPLNTTTDRVAQFTTLAKNLHAQMSDIVYAGGVQLSGLKWDYLLLQKRIHIAAVDADGATLTTGWEAAGGYLTECEFNLTEQTTTLVINSSQLQIMGLDVEKLKQSLGIRPLIPIYRESSFVRYTPKPTPGPVASGGQSSVDSARTTFDVRSGTQTELVGYFDPVTGRQSR